MQLKGKSACTGYSIGKIAIYDRTETKVVRKKCKDPEAEIERFEQAIATAKQEYERLYEKALKEVGSNNASIFKADMVLLDDMDYIESVTNIVRTQSVNAEYAVAITIDNFAKMMSKLEDAYIKDRIKDVREVYNKVIEILYKGTCHKNRYDEPVILLAEDLTPGEIVRLDKTNIIGFVVSETSSNSHTAILSKSLNIPALIGVDLYGYVDENGNISITESIAPQLEGKTAILDGHSGRFIIDPTDEEIEIYNKRISKENKNKKLLNLMKGKKTVTRSGRVVGLYANINNEKDVAAALLNDAEGAGLYRSEYLFMERDSAPSEEEQFIMYRRMAESLGGRKLIIRTADIGADKQVSYLELGKEENPALGYRGIRISLDKRELFETQLRAVYRASYFGNISIMFPMITSVEEVREVKEITERVKKGLKDEGYPYKDCPIGIMVETPAAVMISDLLAKEVDFFSIGTNDLSQYTLAADRTNLRIQKYYNPHHESILRQIKMTIDNAHANDCSVGICGEIASDAEIVKKLVEYGIDDISVTPTNILVVREIIRNME